MKFTTPEKCFLESRLLLNLPLPHHYHPQSRHISAADFLCSFFVHPMARSRPPPVPTPLSSAISIPPPLSIVHSTDCDPSPFRIRFLLKYMLYLTSLIRQRASLPPAALVVPSSHTLVPPIPAKRALPCRHWHSGPFLRVKFLHKPLMTTCSHSGTYCGPLRMLAWEAYDTLTSRHALKCNLVTGQVPTPSLVTFLLCHIDLGRSDSSSTAPVTPPAPWKWPISTCPCPVPSSTKGRLAALHPQPKMRQTRSDAGQFPARLGMDSCAARPALQSGAIAAQRWCAS